MVYDTNEEIKLWEAHKLNNQNLINAHIADIRAGAINGPDQLKLVRNAIAQLKKEIRDIDATIATIKKQRARQALAQAS